MIKYIDAEELLKRLNACKYSVEKTTRRQVAYNAAINAACRSVDTMPAADVVEIVRCADCRFLTFSDMYGECGKGIMGVVNPNDYCSRGERRNG